MKKILLLITAASLTGCSMLNLIPSKWDGNETKIITDIQVTAKYFNCLDANHDIIKLQKQIAWFEIYSRFNGSRDVSTILVDISKTVNEFKIHSDETTISPIYCDLKLKIIKQQADISAKLIHGRAK